MTTRLNICVGRWSSGSTLIELMIAIIIGLIMVLASFQVMAVFEGHKRTTSAMNDALQSGGFGLYALDKLASSSGSGLVQATSFAYGCPLTYTSSGGATVAAGTVGVTLPDPFGGVLAAGGGLLRLAPAVIFPGASVYPTGAPSDTFMLMSGGAGFAEVPIPITPLPVITSVLLTVDSTVGLYANDWLLVGAAGVGCTVTPVVAVPSNVALTLNGTYPMVPYATGYVVDLGRGAAASFMMYGVGPNDALYSIDLLNSDLVTRQEVSDDIVTMHAVYGVDPSLAGVGPLTWTNPVAGIVIGGLTYDYSPAGLLNGTPAATAALRSIKAIRLAIIVRAPLSERWSASDTTISATSNAISAGTYPMFGTLPTMPYNVATSWSVPAGQETYRYRVLEGTIPLRNASF